MHLGVISLAKGICSRERSRSDCPYLVGKNSWFLDIGAHIVAERHNSWERAHIYIFPDCYREGKTHYRLLILDKGFETQE